MSAGGAQDIAEPARRQQDLEDEIAELERRLSRKQAALGTKRITPVPREGTLVCTRQQEGLWFEHRLDPASTAYHIPVALRLRGALDETALHRALHALVTRHEALRTRFVEQDGLPRQIIDPPLAYVRPTVIDLPADAVGAWVTEQIRCPMDLATGPVFRTALARLTPDDHVLVLVAHHMVADGWSVGILARELTRLYAAETGTTTVARLPDLAVQPADHAAWQRARLDDELDSQLDHWRTTLADLPTLDFPTDRVRPAHPTGAGALIDRPLPHDVSAAAYRYSRDHHVSFLAVHHAALLTVLHRYTGQTDLPIGSIFSGRTHVDVEPMVGYFANTLVLRTDAGGEPSFAELVRRCHDTVLEATRNQDVPYSVLVDALQPDRVAGRTALFQICLTLQRAGGAGGGLTLGAVVAEPVDLAGEYSRFDLSLDVTEQADGDLYVSVEYSTELFDADRVDRLVDHFTAALAGGLADPDTAAHDIELMSPEERRRVLHGWSP